MVPTCLLMKQKRYLKAFINNALAPFKCNSTLTVEDYLYPICKASSCFTYIETICNKADSLHRKIEQIYEEDIFNAQLGIIKPLLRKYRNMPVALAFDVTDEDFYGKTSNIWIHNWTGEHGVEGKFEYLVVSLVGMEKHQLLAVPLHIGYNKTELIDCLMKSLNKLFKNIHLVLLDRGFYSGEVLAYLQEHGINYLVFVPRNKRIKKYWSEGGDYVYHTIKYNTGNTNEKITIKHVFIEYDKMKWTFATNLNLRNAVHYIFAYKQRWQIETNFRVQDESSIKSKSCNYLVRYFYFMISLLLQFLWKVFGKKQFKYFVISLYEYFFLNSIGVEYVHQS